MGWLNRYRYPNTRQYLRLSAPWPIRIERRSGPSERRDQPSEDRRISITKDVSAGGIGLAVKEIVPVGSPIYVEIFIPPLNRTICAKGQVVRVNAQRNNFDLGIRFVQIDPEERTALNEAILQFYTPEQQARHQGTWRRKVA